jgi:hypothetical protein
MSVAGDVGSCITGGAALIALPIAIRQIRLMRATSRETRVYAYMDRLNQENTVPLIAKTRDFWMLGGEEGPEEWEKRTDRLTRHELVLVMNLFEELGQMYADGRVDRRLARRLLGHTSQSFFGEAKWFIDHMRQARGDHSLWEDWEAMNRRLAEPERTWHRLGEPWPPGSSVLRGADNPR